MDKYLSKIDKIKTLKEVIVECDLEDEHIYLDWLEELEEMVKKIKERD